MPIDTPMFPPPLTLLLTAHQVAQWFGYHPHAVVSGTDWVRRHPALRALAIKVSPRGLRWPSDRLTEVLGGPTRRALLTVREMEEMLQLSRSTVRNEWADKAVWTDPLRWRIEDVEAALAGAGAL